MSSSDWVGEVMGDSGSEQVEVTGPGRVGLKLTSVEVVAQIEDSLRIVDGALVLLTGGGARTEANEGGGRTLPAGGADTLAPGLADTLAGAETLTAGEVDKLSAGELDTLAAAVT